MMRSLTATRTNRGTGVILMGRKSMKKFRWTDWLAAAAVVMALGAFAGAEAGQDAPILVADSR
jgi:hypothetical protein